VDGYTLGGGAPSATKSEVTCNSNGEFSGMMSCEEVSCGSPSDKIENSPMAVSEFLYNLASST